MQVVFQRLRCPIMFVLIRVTYVLYLQSDHVRTFITSPHVSPTLQWFLLGLLDRLFFCLRCRSPITKNHVLAKMTSRRGFDSIVHNDEQDDASPGQTTATSHANG